jgi:predicted ATPase
MTPDPASIQDGSARLDRARRTLAGLQGARGEVSARLDELKLQVGVAKGRTELKGKVDVFLEEMQAEAHQRNVGSFEKLLSLLAREVIPGSTEIGLELTTERGLPSLDIFARRADGEREDVFEDKGGAFTNVVCAGLRLIAAVKCGGRRFLVLDEPDCWIKPGQNVTDFFRVFRQAAEQVGIQCLVISHHPHAMLGDGIEIARLESDGTTSSIVSSEGARRAWSDDTPGIRAIRLVNVQMHASSEILLGPGVTALIGPNDRGKSSVVRALAAAFYGEARPSLISHGQAVCSVEIDLEDGRTLAYVRNRRKSPANTWTLRERDGAVVVEDGVRHETGGRAVPDWVGAKIGVAPVDDLRIHVSSQKTPVFLLGETPSRRASVLSVGQETSHLRHMIALQRERVVRDQQTVRDGEREVFALTERLAALSALETIETEIAAAESALGSLRRRVAEADELDRALSGIEALSAVVAADRTKLALLAEAPTDSERDGLGEALRTSAADAAAIGALAEAERLAGEARGRLAVLANLPEPPALAPADEIAVLASTIESAQLAGETLAARLAALEALTEPPALRSSDDVTAIGKEIVTAAAALAGSREAFAELDARIAEAEAEIAALLEDIGNTCPACGQPVGVDDFLRGTHSKEAA